VEGGSSLAMLASGTDAMASVALVAIGYNDASSESDILLVFRGPTS
jgi:hypothetical protein